MRLALHGARIGGRTVKEASAERCREQAAQHRRMAEATEDAALRQKLLEIAAAYEELAEHIRRTRRPTE
jgi:hypothetical protein